MRTKKSIINTIFGIVSKLLTLIIQFIIRVIFIKYLKNEFLGYEGLFTNILGVLSLVDLGLGTAISFSLFKPINESNNYKISAIMNLYKKIYISLGFLILILSICVTPFMNCFIKGGMIDINYIRLCFIAYSASCVITYFFGYNRTLIFAYQNNYLINIIDLLSLIIGSVGQICVLYLFKSYFLFIVVKFVYLLISNVIISRVAEKKCFYYKEKNAKLTHKDKLELIMKVKDLAITNICGVGIQSTDNIIISSIVGITSLSLYSNYSMLIMGVTSLINSIADGITASVGDLIAENNSKSIKNNFNFITIFYFLISFSCSLIFYNVCQPFISIWIGNSYVLSNIEVTVLSVNMYLVFLMKPLSIFLNLSGLYSEYKKNVFIAMCLNLFFSILFALKFGMIGVFLGTTFSYVYQLYSFPKILYNNLIYGSARFWYRKQILLFVFFVAMLFFENSICNLVDFNNYIQFTFNLIFSIIIILVTTLVVIKQTNDLKNFFLKILKK